MQSKVEHAQPSTHILYCPIDRSSLRRIQLDAGLPAFECSGCTGHWVRFGDYVGWRERQPSEFAEVPTPEGVQAHRAPEFGRWLAGHPRRSEVLAYLQWVSR